MRKVLSILCVLLVLSGALFAAFPLLSGFFLDTRMHMETSRFLEMREKQKEEDSTVGLTENTGEDSLYPELLSACTGYNKTTVDSHQANVTSEQEPIFSLQDYGLESEVFGVLSVPKIDLELPVYLGATQENMALGAAIMNGTSLPTGDGDANCVIVGHRGYHGAPYFRYIDKLEKGDAIYLKTPWETLTYTVGETKIIEPDDVDAILIQPGRNLLTLLTCHPYASGGKYRLLVFCERAS